MNVCVCMRECGDVNSNKRLNGFLSYRIDFIFDIYHVHCADIPRTLIYYYKRKTLIPLLLLCGLIIIVSIENIYTDTGHSHTLGGAIAKWKQDEKSSSFRMIEM